MKSCQNGNNGNGYLKHQVGVLSDRDMLEDVSASPSPDAKMINDTPCVDDGHETRVKNRRIRREIFKNKKD